MLSEEACGTAVYGSRWCCFAGGVEGWTIDRALGTELVEIFETTGGGGSMTNEPRKLVFDVEVIVSLF